MYEPIQIAAEIKASTANILDNIEPDSVYVFSYNGNCIITQGSFINTELFTGYPTYTMTSANIVNAGFAPASPCESCTS